MVTDQLATHRLMLAPYVACRQVGLPTDAIWKAGNFRVAELCDRLRVEQEQLAQTAAELVDELYGLIKRETESQTSNRLLALKRNVYNGRLVDSDRAKAMLPDRLHPLVERWVLQVDQLATTKMLAETAVNESLPGLLQAFLPLLGQNHVQTAICHAQPELFRLLLDLPSGGNLNRQHRKVLLSGVAYLYRMATKTSPFSHFTRTGCWPLDQKVTQNTNGQEFNEINVLNIGIGQRLVSCLLNNPRYADKLPLIWNPATVLTDEYCLVLHANPPAAGSEPVIQPEWMAVMPANPIFFVLQAFFAEHPRPIDRNELVTRLTGQLPYEPERIQKILTKLISQKLLIPTLGFDENRLDWITALAQSQPVLNLSDNLSGELVVLADEVRLVAELNPADRLTKLHSLTQRSRGLLASLGVETPTITVQKIIHNSVYLHESPATHAESIAEHLPDFESLLQVLPLFNADYALQQWVNSKLNDILAEDGTPLPALACFYHLFALGDHADELDENSPLLNAEALFDLHFSQHQRQEQARFVAEISDLMADVAEQLTLDESFWASWGEAAQPFQTQSMPLSVTVMGQFEHSHSSIGDSPRFVLNKLFAGYGTLLTEPPLTARKTPSNDLLASHLSRIQAGCWFADIVATMGFQGQIRPPVSPKSLYYPGQQIGESMEGYFSWNDLYIKRDEHGHPILFDRSSGERVVPLHRGTLATFYFPPFYRFLTTLGPAFTPDFSLYERLLDHDDNREIWGIRHYPRVVSGGLVLMRRAWSVPLDMIPQQLPKQTDLAYYQTMIGWATEVGLPKEVFVVPMRYADFLKNEVSDISFKRTHKPVYLHWDDYTSFRLFLRYAVFGQGGRISFIEALPALAPSEVSATNRVTEYQFEVYQHAPSL